MYEETLPFAFAVGNMQKQAIRRHLLQQATENGAVLCKVEKVSEKIESSESQQLCYEAWNKKQRIESGELKSLQTNCAQMQMK